ncbi:MAG: HD domain-containing phosphohydrolase [Trueperaceae bacterium]
MNYRQFHISAEKLEPIEAMATGIATASSQQEVFRALLLFASYTTPGRAIFITLYTPSTGLRKCMYAGEIIEGDDGRRVIEEADIHMYPELPLNTSPQSRAILSGTFFIANDYDKSVAGLPVTDSGSDMSKDLPRSSLAIPLGFEGRTRGALEIQSPALSAFDESHVPPLSLAASLAVTALENLDLMERERAQHEATLRTLGLALEYRDYETKGHTDRVVRLSVAFAHALGLNDAETNALRWGAYLHDLGKVALPDQILLKPGRLSASEYQVIRRHTLIGIDMCRDIPFLETGTRDVIRSHHERWDGRGYPDQLAGDQIPLLARIFSLVDVYDALISRRPYKDAWPHERALAEIRDNSEIQFDPKLLETFVRVAAARDLEN